MTTVEHSVMVAKAEVAGELERSPQTVYEGLYGDLLQDGRNLATFTRLPEGSSPEDWAASYARAYLAERKELATV